MARRLAAVMFTDLAGYTALAQADEAGALRLLQEQDRLVRPLLEAHRGRKVKSMGDGLLIEFSNALDAVECAVDLQRHIHEHNPREGAPMLRMRVGIHLGDVQRRGTDILGDAVNIASRVVPLSDPGGVCLSEPVFVQVHNKVPYQLERLGPKNLKGVQEPVEVYRVALPWAVHEAEPGDAAPTRLAVLPLTNMSPDPNDEYFADGLTEEIIATVSRIRELNVISRTSVMQYKNQTKRMAEIGRELTAGTILEGSVRKAGNRARIAVQLIDAVSDKHLWAENYDRNIEDIFEVQSEIAQKVANALEVRLHEADKERLGKVSTEVTEAHLLYMKGVFHQQHLTKDESLTAVGYFERAVQKDPRYALAHASIASTYSFLGFQEMIPFLEASSKAEVAAREALELDGSLAEAHLAFAWVLFAAWNFAGAVKETECALALNPNLSQAHLFAGDLYNEVGRPEDSLKAAARALDLDPLSASTLRGAATIYLYSRRPEMAARLYLKAIALDPGDSFARGNLGLCYVRQGRYDEGIAEISRSIEMSGASFLGSRADLTYALAQAGRAGEARDVLAGLIRHHETTGTGAYAVACGYASVGNRNAALDWLERAYLEHSAFLATVSSDFAFEAMHGDPKFEGFLRKMGYPPKPTHS
jgi:adenylate cyclase